MKNVKKLLGILLIMALVMSIGIASAFADVIITVNRDTTYEEGGTSESGNREYKWYRVFTVVKDGTYETEGGGYDTDGTPGSVTGTNASTATAFAYTASLTVANKLGTYDATAGTWTAASGQTWFKLTPIAGSAPQTFSVEWVAADDSTDTAQLAAAWLYSNSAYDESGDLTVAADGKSWSASGLQEGYYLLSGSEGKNLIAATTNITINEKNSYPTVDKKQKDSEAGTYADKAINVKVGDTVYYQVEVKVPANANTDIKVTDTMTAGLTYDTTTDLVVKVGDTALTPDDSATHDYLVGTKTAQSWIITIHPTAETVGKTVVITFATTVNNDALVQTNRKNDVEIQYGNYQQKDTVEHDIGAAAIIKYDGATANLDKDANTLSVKSPATSIKYLEATFTLTDSKGAAVNVKEATSGTKGVYVVDTTATSNSVTSDKAHNGVILIYGLDPDETYTLTETATEAGYNLLSDTVSLTPTKAENTAVNTIKVTVAEATGITAGDSAADADHTLELTAKQVNKVENNSGTVLPSTGGVGTTIFYVVGALLVVGAGVVLVTRRKVDSDK